jgi:hypothetical protein
VVAAAGVVVEAAVIPAAETLDSEALAVASPVVVEPAETGKSSKVL